MKSDCRDIGFGKLAAAPWVLGLAIAILIFALPQQASAQAHGIGTTKDCSARFVGETISCEVVVSSLEAGEGEDTIDITSVTDSVSNTGGPTVVAVDVVTGVTGGGNL